MKTFRQFLENAPSSVFKGWEIPSLTNVSMFAPMYDALVDNDFRARDVAHFLNKWLETIKQSLTMFEFNMYKKNPTNLVLVGLAQVMQQIDNVLKEATISVQYINVLDTSVRPINIDNFIYLVRNLSSILDDVLHNLEEFFHEHPEHTQIIRQYSRLVKSIQDYIEHSHIGTYLQQILHAIER